MEKHKTKKSSTEEVAAYLDESLPKLLSIVAYLECGDATALQTGDARGDNIIKGLDKAGLDDTAPLKVDSVLAKNPSVFNTATNGAA